MIEDLIQAAILVFNIKTLIAISLGTIVGLMIGAIPGLSATMGMALLSPFKTIYYKNTNYLLKSFYRQVSRDSRPLYVLVNIWPIWDFI